MGTGGIEIKTIVGFRLGLGLSLEIRYTFLVKATDSKFIVKGALLLRVGGGGWPAGFSRNKTNSAMPS